MKHGHVVGGKSVLGGVSDLPRLVERYGIRQVLIAVPTLKPLNRGTAGVHTFNISNDPSLVGRTFWTQAATFKPGQIQLTNAIDITLGY